MTIRNVNMEKQVTIALAGNPNSGKTSIFNNLTGAKQHVGNWPGVTVEKKEGTCRYNGYQMRIVDLPGAYSLTAYSMDEVVARNFIITERPDVVVDIVDASNLQRNLYLTTQFKELGIKVVIALNMSDVAERNGVNIDVKKMSELLGAQVVPTVGHKNRGMKELLETAVRTAEGKSGLEEHPIAYGKEIEPEIEQIQSIIARDESLVSQYSPRWLALKLLEEDKEVVKAVETSPLWKEVRSAVEKSQSYLRDHMGDDAETLIADQRYGFIAGLAAETVQKPPIERVSLSDKIDKVITNRVCSQRSGGVNLRHLYSMGETDPEEAESLREAIQSDPFWTPLKAFTFMLFCLLYVPCFVATVVFHKEAGSWKWTGFMVLYTTVLAWVASFMVYQGGMLLGLS
jgi:ferrous iron transport protein B